MKKNKTGFDRLREEIGSQEQNEYILIALGIQEYHRIEKENGQPYLTEWFDHSWVSLEKTAYVLASYIEGLRMGFEMQKKYD